AKYVVENYPKIIWIGCASHRMNLLLENLFKMNNFNYLLDSGHKIAVFFKKT
ncbi:unnamed protein product, partial [marine sediment metagenome]